MKADSIRFPLVVLLALACFGCSSKSHVTRPIVPTQTRPVPDSPVNALRLFEWGWSHRDVQVARSVLTADFAFVFAPEDSAGNLFREPWIDRAETLNIFRNLFVGGSAEPPADSISLTFDQTLLAMPDSRPGRNGAWHKEIVTGVDLVVKTGAQEYFVTGHARFFVVRGDSAVIPPDLGASPDSGRWYIEQVDDGTVPGPGGAVALPVGPSRTQPAHALSWGQVLALYR